MDHAAIVPRLSPAQSACLIPLRYRIYALAIGRRKLPGDDETPPDFSRQHRRWRGRVLPVSGAAPTRVGGLVLADRVRAAGRVTGTRVGGAACGTSKCVSLIFWQE
jgi:hypothetical protein